MTKQDKIKKVMKEFKNGTLKTPDGKVVKDRKQALAIAMSESEGYTEKADLIGQINIDSTADALDILKSAGEEDIFEKAKHQDGDIHPNGKWVWVASANGGKGDWRTNGGRAHKKAGAAAGSGGTSVSTTSAGKSVDTPKPTAQRKLTTKQQTIVDNFMDKVKTSDSRYSDPSKVTLWKTPKGNWYVKYDGHQVATIAPLGLTEKIAEAAGMKIDREPSSYQSSKTTTTQPKKTKQKKLRPVGTGTNGPERRTKEAQERIDKKRKEKEKSTAPDFGDLNKVLNWVQNDLKDYDENDPDNEDWTPGFSVTLDRKNDRMVFWDANGNNPTQIKYDKATYDKMMKHLKDTYDVETTDTNRLGASESYKFAIKKKK